MHQIYAEHMYKPGSVLGTGGVINSKGPHNSVTEILKLLVRCDSVCKVLERHEEGRITSAVEVSRR